MNKKLIKGIALSIMLASSLAGVATAVAAPSKQEVMIAEAATTYSENVKIQTKLKRWGYYSGAVDGIYGNQTRKAVRYFQSKNGLAVDGIVGPKTAAAMGITLSGSKGASASTSSSDLNLLARCVYAEARGEPYTGQVAVAAVVLNRVKNSAFPNTISGVIYQPWAFTAVNDGQINLTPNSTAYKAAQDALNGWDPTYGCLYYYNPATATSSWIWSRKTVVTIGKHVFAL
ncbi:MAG: spore cortex-lytic enzyme [Clostridia bacterium]|nr:spore cortex-lytic enzyme [Clostridia bacterium]